MVAEKFSSFLLAEAKNLHLEHLEDRLIDEGTAGGYSSLNVLRSFLDMLEGSASKPLNVTLKWDGAPAIFAGLDPEDRKFFVAKKGIFNKNPKIYKTHADISADLSGDLERKFHVALDEFSKLGIRNVVQGDLMFTAEDLKTETIAGEQHVTFHPNTILYAVPVGSDLARKILRARIGVVWHTTYSGGSSLADMSASFGKDIATKLKNVSSVWQQDATYRDISGTVLLTKKETQSLKRTLDAAEKLLRQVPNSALDAIRSDPEVLQKFKTYLNSLVRTGEGFRRPGVAAANVKRYVESTIQKTVEKLKTPAARERKEKTLRDKMRPVLEASEKDLQTIFKAHGLLSRAKDKVVQHLSRADSMKTLLRTSRGFEVTSHEGFVAIDRVGNAVKLVDRLEFSRANFSPDIVKGWQ